MMRLGQRAYVLAVAWTLIAGFCGGAAFHFLQLPAPWLSGPLVAMVIAIAFGRRPVLPGALRDNGMLLAGVITGSSITVDMLRAVAKYPGSIFILLLTTAAIILGGQMMLVQVFHWDRKSAFFASVPGALSVVIATVASVGGDMARIVAAQAFRMIVLIALLPSIVMTAFPAVATAPAGTASAADFSITMTVAVAVSFLFERLRVMAPYLLGGMAAAGALSVTQFVQGVPPPTVANAAMLLVGIFAGSRFSGMDISQFRRLLLAGVSLFLLTCAIAAIGALAVWHFVGVPLAEALVAYAPGGLEAMVILGLALGLDPLYISSHHVIRFIMVAAILPFACRRYL